MSNDNDSIRPELPEEFVKLRGMESFTRAMFDRIISFQERDHPAWDPTRPFAERIADLPLHALIFSNPDRDPAVNAQTVAPFYPLRDEIRQIAHLARQVAEDPLVCDVHGRNGFLGSLIGAEGVRVLSLHDDALLPCQIEDFHDPAVCKRIDQGIDVLEETIDVAVSAWMPAGVNRMPAILAKRPALIVLIYTEHRNEETGERQTGTDEAYATLPEEYRVIAEWSILRPRDLLHEAWPDLTPSIEEERQVRVLARRPFHDIEVELPTASPSSERYAWEADLEMALTVLRAKAFLREQGHAV